MTNRDDIERAARALLDLSERSVAMAAQRPTAREWEEARYALRAALAKNAGNTPPTARATRGEAPDLIEERCAIAKRVYLALGGEPENVETGNSLFQTVKAAVFADWYAPTPPPATGEAGTSVREPSVPEWAVKEAIRVCDEWYSALDRDTTLTPRLARALHAAYTRASEDAARVVDAEVVRIEKNVHLMSMGASLAASQRIKEARATAASIRALPEAREGKGGDDPRRGEDGAAVDAQDPMARCGSRGDRDRAARARDFGHGASGQCFDPWHDNRSETAEEEEAGFNSIACQPGSDPAMAEYVAASLAWWLDESPEAERMEGETWERFHRAYYRLPVSVRMGAR